MGKLDLIRIMQDSTLEKFLLSVLYLSLILATSLRPAFKYSEGLPVFFLFVAATVALLLLWANSRFGWWLRSFTSSTLFPVGLFVGWLVLAIYFYPRADALKLQGLGQDQDDCLISGSLALMRLENPYLEPTYFGNPCSPLPGAIIPYVPFVLAGGFAIAGVFYLGLAGLAVRLELGPVGSGLFLAILAVTPLTLELLVNGSDFLFMGSGLVVLGILVDKASKGGNSIYLIPAAVLAGLVSSTRVNMPIVLVLFVGYLVLVRIQRRAIAIVIAILTSFGPGVLIYLSDPASFTPLHLLSKGERLLPGWLLFAMLLLTGLLLISSLVLKSQKDVSFSSKLLSVTGPSVVSLSFADLASRNFDFAAWEGASYLMVIIPLLSLLLAQMLVKTAGDACARAKQKFGLPS